MNPSQRIDQLIADLTDWRGKTLASIRKSILEADWEIIEEWKWMGSPVWSRDGMIAVGNAHKDKVKLTFSNRYDLSPMCRVAHLQSIRSILFPTRGRTASSHKSYGGGAEASCVYWSSKAGSRPRHTRLSSLSISSANWTACGHARRRSECSGREIPILFHRRR
jgi:hypothetical protein